MKEYNPLYLAIQTKMLSEPDWYLAYGDLLEILIRSMRWFMRAYDQIAVRPGPKEFALSANEMQLLGFLPDDFIKAYPEWNVIGGGEENKTPSIDCRVVTLKLPSISQKKAGALGISVCPPITHVYVSMELVKDKALAGDLTKHLNIPYLESAKTEGWAVAFHKNPEMALCLAQQLITLAQAEYTRVISPLELSRPIVDLMEREAKAELVTIYDLIDIYEKENPDRPRPSERSIKRLLDDYGVKPHSKDGKKYLYLKAPAIKAIFSIQIRGYYRSL